MLNSKGDKGLNQIRIGQKGDHQALKFFAGIGRIQKEHIESPDQEGYTNTDHVVQGLFGDDSHSFQLFVLKY